MSFYKYFLKWRIDFEDRIGKYLGVIVDEEIIE